MNEAIAVAETPLVGDIVLFAGQIKVGGAELAILKDKDPLAITPLEACTIIVNADVGADGVVENVKVCPPSLVVNPEGVVVAEAVKSEATPVVAPLVSETVIVHPMAMPL